MRPESYRKQKSCEGCSHAVDCVILYCGKDTKIYDGTWLDVLEQHKDRIVARSGICDEHEEEEDV